MIELLKNRSFQLWEYRVSHGSLLIRSPKKSGLATNVDLKFFGVEYISVPRHLREIALSYATDEEERSLARLLGKHIGREKIFVFESPTGRYLIVAAGMKVEENELDIFESPFG